MQNFIFGDFVYKVNASIVNQLIFCLRMANSDDLFCLKNDLVCFIFCKDSLKFGEKNLSDYICKSFAPLKHILQFSILDKNSEIYKKHIVRISNKEFLWKYIQRYGYELQKFLYFDENNEVYIDGSIIKEADSTCSESNMIINNNIEKRKFIEGITVDDYLQGKTHQEKVDMLVKMTKFFFDKYTVEDDKIDGLLWDFHWNNVIIDKEGKFHFIDNDFVSRIPLDKKRLLNYMLNFTYDKKLQEDVNKYFGY